MLHFSPSRLVIVLLLSALLAAGCKSPGSKESAGDRAAARPAAAGHSDDKELDRLAAAHAHYAAAIIDEMNQRSDAALDEYYQAAINDPNNEKLTLDLSRKLLQNKQPDKAV